MTKRTNHYATSDEKFVKTTILYMGPSGDSPEPWLYYDKDFKDPVYVDELEDLYLDGVEVYTITQMDSSQKAYLKPLICVVDLGKIGVMGDAQILMVNAFNRTA